MRLTYKAKAQAGDRIRHLVFVGGWLLGDLMIGPSRVTFHPASEPTRAYHFKSREAFEATLDEYVS